MANLLATTTIDAIWRTVGLTYANNVLLERLPNQSTQSSALLIRLKGNSGNYDFITPSKQVFVEDMPLLLYLKQLWDGNAGEINWGLRWRIQAKMRYNSSPAQFKIYEVY